MSEPKTKAEMLKAAADARDLCKRWDESGEFKTSAYWRIATSASYWSAKADGRVAR